MSKLSVFLNPVHGRPTDVEFIRHLQPASVKIVNPDVQKVSDVHAAAPNALIVLRNHPRSEEHDAAYSAPEVTGARHALADAQMVAEMLQQAQQRNIPFPSYEEIALCGLNEPHVWTNLNEAVRYYAVYLDTLKSSGLRGLALSLSVGWPGNTGPNTPPVWTAYQPVYDAIKRGGHFLGLHEYWSHGGPQDNWGWWAGRYTKCPWDVPIIIGECGVDAAVADGNTDYLKRGWRAKLTPEQYVAQLAAYDAELMKDSRVHSAQVFATDGGREWFSFDTEPAHSAWLDYAAKAPVPTPETAANIAVGDDIRALYVVNVHQAPGLQGGITSQIQTGKVIKVTGGPQSASGLTWWQTVGGWVAETTPDGTRLFEKAKPQSDWDKAIAFVLKWEGGYVDGNAIGDPGGETNFGISKRSYPSLDIKNLTRDQAVDIYLHDYWMASGAEQLSWPINLVHFDSAVNCGVAQAIKWYATANGNATAYLGMRLDFYTRIGGWHFFGAAWVRRVADLLALFQEA